MPRPKLALEGSASVSIRLPNALLERVDRFIRWFQKEFPGLTIGRPDVIRLAVAKLTEKTPDKTGLAQILDLDTLEAGAVGARLYSEDEIASFLEQDQISPQIMKRFRQATESTS